MSTLGLVMVHNTGIAAAVNGGQRPEPATAPPGTSSARVVGAGGGAPAVGIAAVGTGDAAADPLLDLLRRRLAQHRVTRAAVLSQLSTQLVAQRDAATAATADQAAATQWVRPIEARITQRFSTTNHHFGVDFGASAGTRIVAAHRGTVVFAGQMSGYGNVVLIQHDDNVVTLYAHMRRFVVHQGQVMAAGDLVGYEGSTGHSTGPHLHFEVRLGGQDGSKVDPVTWLAAHGVSYG